MDYPARKQLRLKHYDYSQAGAYFVTMCTDKKQAMLSAITVGRNAHIAPQVKLTQCGEIVEQYIVSTEKSTLGVKIPQYVIMPNHVHLLVLVEYGQRDGGAMWASPPTKSISSVVRSIKTLSTKMWGAPIWQTSYYDHIIRGEQDYLDVWKYMDENPLKWSEDEYYV